MKYDNFIFTYTMERLMCLTSLLAAAEAGSCYYTRQDKFYYTRYEYCLTGCCGSYVIYGVKHCCSDVGATVGIIISAVVFVAIIVAICFYRRRRRRMYATLQIPGNGQQNDTERLIQPQPPYTSGQPQPPYPNGPQQPPYPNGPPHPSYQNGPPPPYQNSSQPGSGNVYPHP